MTDSTRQPPLVVAIAVDGSDVSLVRRAEDLARALALPLASAGSETGHGLLLTVTTSGLELREWTNPAPGDGRRPPARPSRSGVRVDLRPLVLRRGRGNLSRRQPLARAVGQGRRTVADATAGLGQDAALLALLGYDVTAIERSPVLAALLEDGLDRAEADPAVASALGGRLRVVRGDAREILGDLLPPPDVVYIDPMFPPKRKSSALAKKSIRLVRRLVGGDEDAAALLAVARRCARDRVVVKRPTSAHPLGGEPALSFGGKLVRYDVYLVGRDACTGANEVSGR